MNYWYGASLWNFFSSYDLSNISFGCYYLTAPSDWIRYVQGSFSYNNLNWNFNLNSSYWYPIILCWDYDYLYAYLSLQLWLDCNTIPNYMQPFIFELYDISNSTPTPPNCSQCESELSSCNSYLSSCKQDLNTLSWNYASLNSSFTQLEANYNSCMTDTSHCETLVWVCYENLSGCQETNSSLQNYNDSLSQQLNECLENWSWWVWSWIYLSSFDLFWSDEGVNYSLPITNNIFLPYWYRWFLDDGVLAIRNVNSLNSALSLDNSSYQQGVIDNLWKVFLFLMSCGLILVFLYTIRRYFIWLKSIK